MTSCQTGNKPLLQPMMTQLSDTYIHHQWVKCVIFTYIWNIDILYISCDIDLQ